MQRDKTSGDDKVATNSSQRLMAPLPPGDATPVADDETSAPPVGGEQEDTAAAALRKSRKLSSQLMDAGNPEKRNLGAGTGGGRIVTARLSVDGSALVGEDAEEALRCSGVGLMETKVRYSHQKSAGAKREKAAQHSRAPASGKVPEMARAARPAGDDDAVGSRPGGTASAGGGVLDSKIARKSGGRRPPNGAAVAARSRPGETVSTAGGDVLDSKMALKNRGRRRPPGGGAAAVTSSRPGETVSTGGDVLDSKMALKNRGRRRPPSGAAAAAAPSPASAETETVAERMEISPSDVVAETSIDEGDLKPGATAVYPTDTSQSERDRDANNSSYQLHDDKQQHPYVDIMAEAHLVEEDDSDDDGAGGRGRKGRENQAGGGFDDESPLSPPAVAVVATAKRVSPVVRFAQDHCLLVVALALLIVGGIAGLSAFLATRNTNTTTTGDGEGEDGTDGIGAPFRSTAAPTFSLAPSASSAPSPAPTTNPTQAPTMPCDTTPELRSAAIIDLVSSLAAAGSPSLALDNDGGSSEAHALAARWLAEEDTLYPPLCPDRDATRLGQRFGLALMHFALGGEEEDGGERGWTYRPSEDNFLKDINECDWAGVDCNSDTKMVTRIELVGRNIRGSLPAELFTLFGDLRVINLEVNRVRGCIPDEISMASSLEFFYLSANEIDCELPRSLPAELREIKLVDNSISGPIPSEMLMGLTKLQTLMLGRNVLSGEIPREIDSLAALRTLHLDQNSLNSSLPLELFNLPSLVSLRLNGNSFDSTVSSSIAQLSKVEELYLHDNFLSGEIPDAVFSLDEIRSLAVSQNFFSGTLADQVGTAKTLEILRLDGNSLNGTLPESVSQLSNLEILSIQWNDINGNVDDEICSLRVDSNASTGNLRRLYSDCGDSDPLDEFACDTDWDLCCTCCDCVDPKPRGSGGFSVCYPFGEEDTMGAAVEGSFPPSRSDLIIQKIIQYNVSDASALLQSSSPQQLAASWVINDDALQLNPSDSSLLQRYAMVVLYFATNGDNWLQCSGTDGTPCDSGIHFLSNTSVCEWAGISCYTGYFAETIDSIHLVQFGLTGLLPTRELSGLCLTYLSFRGNTGILIDHDSEHLAGLFSDLDELDLSECALPGQLTEPFFNPQRVYLNDNRFDGTLPSVNYSGLEVLHLQYNELTGKVPDTLGLGLRELQLDNNFFFGALPTSFNQLSDLERLTLHNNEITGTISDTLCDLTFDNGGNLEDLWADCGEGFEVEVECTCCTRCF